MSRVLWRCLATVVGPWVLVPGCVGSSGGGGTGGGSAGATQPQASGGTVGAACQPEGIIGCAPGAKTRVTCKNAAWRLDQTCGDPASCTETKDGTGVVTATACAVPATANATRANVCARAAACTSKVKFFECVNPLPPALFAKQKAATNLLGPEQLLPQIVESQSGCIAAAKDCAGVKACLAGAVPACTSDSDDGCVGSVAKLCSGGATIAVDCAKAGLPCGQVKTTAVSVLYCGGAAKCTDIGTASCSGTTAQGCIGLDKTTGIAAKFDCSAIGGTCASIAQASLDTTKICKLPGGAACDKKTFVPSCAGSVVSTCPENVVVQLDCAVAGATCLVSANPAGKVTGNCTFTPACTAGTAPSCDGNVMRFCDGVAGYRSLDCAVVGMACQQGMCRFGAGP